MFSVEAKRVIRTKKAVWTFLKHTYSSRLNNPSIWFNKLPTIPEAAPPAIPPAMVLPIPPPEEEEEPEVLLIEMGTGVAKAGDTRRAMRAMEPAEVERILMLMNSEVER